jgi:hypothetical protein
MSYEGYSQFLCKQGHYWEEDCYMADFEESLCPVCNTKPVWENMVNLTNGSFDINPKTGKEERIDGYIELKLREQRTCRHCKSIIETIYVIPKKKKQ